LPYEVQIALRYLLIRRRQAFVSVISFVSALGVAVGVMALIVALALMTGLQGELRDRLLGSQAHIYVTKPGGIVDYAADVEQLRGVPRVVGAAPMVLGKALASSGGLNEFITVKGVDPVLEPGVTDLGAAMRRGAVADLETGDEGLRGIIIGDTLSQRLGVFVGDTLTLLTPQGTLSPMGMLPRPVPFRVVGTFSLGLFEVDSSWGFVTLPVAERLFGRTEPEFIQLKVDDLWAAPEVAQAVTSRLGLLYVTQDWTEMNRSLFSALWMERLALGIAIGLIMIVAALQIIASLILLVMEKSPDIGILKTMGASSRSITLIFMLQGLIIGIAGTVVGATGGVALATVLDRYRLIRVPMDVYQIEHVPFVVEPLSLALVVTIAIGVCFLATIYPSRQASRLDPVEALRYG
jgi:lipoprotein-releasing system permease protein